MTGTVLRRIGPAPRWRLVALAAAAVAASPALRAQQAPAAAAEPAAPEEPAPAPLPHDDHSVLAGDLFGAPAAPAPLALASADQPTARQNSPPASMATGISQPWIATSRANN